MSGSATHMLVGAVGGLALVQRGLLPDTYAHQLPLVVVIATSAVLATWPDIDEPRSWIGRRARWSITVLCALVLAIGGWSWRGWLPGPPMLRPLIGAGIGWVLGVLLVGPWLGSEMLTAIRALCGGHRRLTHSLLLSGLLLLGGMFLARLGQHTLALMALSLWWGQLLHLPADLLTGGVPLLFPLSRRSVGLPSTFAPWGEVAITLIAGLYGWWLLT